MFGVGRLRSAIQRAVNDTVQSATDTAKGVTGAVAAKVDRMVKDATPEHAARRAGESAPVWSFEDAGHRQLAGEIDGFFGNRGGGVDLGEIANFRADLKGRIEDQRTALAKTTPGSSAHRDIAEVIHRWEATLSRADEIKAIIEKSDTRLLRDVGGVVQRQSSEVLQGVGALLTQAIGEVANRVQVNVAANVNGPGGTRGGA